MEKELEKFAIYVGFPCYREEDWVHKVKMVEEEYFTSEYEALDYAKNYVYELYNLNPERDVMEIMEQEKVDEDEAFEIFEYETRLYTRAYVIKSRVRNKFLNIVNKQREKRNG